MSGENGWDGIKHTPQANAPENISSPCKRTMKYKGKHFLQSTGFELFYSSQIFSENQLL